MWNWRPPSNGCSLCALAGNCGSQSESCLDSVREVCNFLGSVLSQQKFEVMDQVLKPLDRPCHRSRTDQCYSSVLQLSFI